MEFVNQQYAQEADKQAQLQQQQMGQMMNMANASIAKKQALEVKNERRFNQLHSMMTMKEMPMEARVQAGNEFLTMMGMKATMAPEHLDNWAGVMKFAADARTKGELYRAEPMIEYGMTHWVTPEQLPDALRLQSEAQSAKAQRTAEILNPFPDPVREANTRLSKYGALIGAAPGNYPVNQPQPTAPQPPPAEPAAEPNTGVGRGYGGAAQNFGAAIQGEVNPQVASASSEAQQVVWRGGGNAPAPQDAQPGQPYFKPELARPSTRPGQFGSWSDASDQEMLDELQVAKRENAELPEDEREKNEAWIDWAEETLGVRDQLAGLTTKQLREKIGNARNEIGQLDQQIREGLRRERSMGEDDIPIEGQADAPEMADEVNKEKERWLSVAQDELDRRLEGDVRGKDSLLHKVSLKGPGSYVKAVGQEGTKNRADLIAMKREGADLFGGYDNLMAQLRQDQFTVRGDEKRRATMARDKAIFEMNPGLMSKALDGTLRTPEGGKRALEMEVYEILSKPDARRSPQETAAVDAYFQVFGSRAQLNALGKTTALDQHRKAAEKLQAVTQRSSIIQIGMGDYQDAADAAGQYKARLDQIIQVHDGPEVEESQYKDWKVQLVGYQQEIDQAKQVYDQTVTPQLQLLQAESQQMQQEAMTIRKRLASATPEERTELFKRMADADRTTKANAAMTRLLTDNSPMAAALHQSQLSLQEKERDALKRSKKDTKEVEKKIETEEHWLKKWQVGRAQDLNIMKGEQARLAREELFAKSESKGLEVKARHDEQIRAASDYAFTLHTDEGMSMDKAVVTASQEFGIKFSDLNKEMGGFRKTEDIQRKASGKAAALQAAVAWQQSHNGQWPDETQQHIIVNRLEKQFTGVDPNDMLTAIRQRGGGEQESAKNYQDMFNSALKAAAYDAGEQLGGINIAQAPGGTLTAQIGGKVKDHARFGQAVLQQVEVQRALGVPEQVLNGLTRYAETLMRTPKAATPALPSAKPAPNQQPSSGGAPDVEQRLRQKYGLEK